MCGGLTPLYWAQPQRQILVGASLAVPAPFPESVGLQLKPLPATASMHQEFLL